MKAFCIDKKIIGTEKHLVVDNGFSWADDVPHVWHITGYLKDAYDRCLDTVAKLAGITIDLEPPKAYHDAMQTLMSGSSAWPPPWKHVMPAAAHRSFVGNLVHQVAEALDQAPVGYYEGVWVPGSKVIGSLVPAIIKKDVWEGLVESGLGNVTATRSFQPDGDGFAKVPVYDRFGARTGRCAIRSGPMILTLKREHRSLIGSRWGADGRVVLLDFSALEVRIILYEAGQRCDNPDLYSELNDILFQGSLDRDAVKKAVISALYGQSKWALGEQLGVSKQQLNSFINLVKTYFKVDNLLKSVKGHFIKHGHVLNHYGRRVMIDEPLDHELINSYAQSTGADVVMLGFNEVIDQLRGLRAVPIYLLVDAILIDCHKDDISAVESIKTVKVPGYVQRYPLKPGKL